MVVQMARYSRTVRRRPDRPTIPPRATTVAIARRRRRRRRRSHRVANRPADGWRGTVKEGNAAAVLGTRRCRTVAFLPSSVSFRRPYVPFCARVRISIVRTRLPPLDRRVRKRSSTTVYFFVFSCPICSHRHHYPTARFAEFAFPDGSPSPFSTRV